MNPTPKPLKPAEFAATVVTRALARGLPAEALTAFLTTGIVWRSLRADLFIYAVNEAAVLAGLHADTAMSELLTADSLAALTPAKRKELRGRIKAEREGRTRASAALLALVDSQIAALDAAGPSFRAAEAQRLAENLDPSTSPQ